MADECTTTGIRHPCSEYTYIAGGRSYNRNLEVHPNVCFCNFFKMQTATLQHRNFQAQRGTRITLGVCSVEIGHVPREPQERSFKHMLVTRSVFMAPSHNSKVSYVHLSLHIAKRYGHEDCC